MKSMFCVSVHDLETDLDFEFALTSSESRSISLYSDLVEMFFDFGLRDRFVVKRTFRSDEKD